MAKYDKITIPLGLGIQTDVDDKLLPVGKVVRLENGRWLRGGEVVKAPGTYLLGINYAAATPAQMPQAWQMATHKGALVSVSTAGPRPLGVYSPGVAKWIAPAGSSAVDNILGVSSKLRGQVLPQRTPIFRGNSAGEGARRVTRPTFATDGTHAGVCWIEENAGAAKIWVQFIEVATGKKLFDYNQSVASSTTNIRIVFVNSRFQIVYIDGANIQLRLWTQANIAAGGSGWAPTATTTLAADNSGQQLDAIDFGVDLYVLYNNATTPRMIKWDGAVATVSTITTSVGGALNTGALAWMRDLSGASKRAAIIGSTAQGTSVQWDIAAGTPVSSYVIDAASGFPTFLSGFTISTNATGEFVVLYEVSPPQAVKWGRRTVASGISTATWLLSAGLASMPFLRAGTAFECLIRYDSNDQGTLFVVRIPTNITDATDNNRTPTARLCTGAMITLSSFGGTLTDVAINPNLTNTFLTTANVKTRLVKSPLGDTFDTGIDLITLTYNPSTVNSPREFSDNLYTCGGILGAFDGVTFAEEGFHLAPEITGVTQQLSGNLEVLGNYIAVAVYRKTDAFGRVRRSEPSVAFDFTMTGSNRGALISVKTLKLHGRPCRVNDGGRPGSVVIEIYTTTNNETDDLALAGVIDNDESVDTVTLTHTASDATIAQSGDLYTNGGVLPSRPPPPALATATYKDRIAVVSAEDPTLVWVSFPLVETEGPRFNELSSFRIDDGRGDITGLAAADDRLIVFKKDAIYAILGDGPDVNSNGSFGVPQIIASGIGCSEPRSIAQIPDGVIFRSGSSKTGIFVVNRGLAVEYIGKDVQSYLQTTDGTTSIATVADAVHVPGRQETHIFLSSGNVLIYDHATKLWDVDTGKTALAATAWQPPAAREARPVYQSSALNMTALAEDYLGTVFDANAAAVEQYIESPWLSFADLKGYLRFKRIQLVGEKRSIGTAGYQIEMKLYKDFDGSTPFLTSTRTLAITDDINAQELRYSAKLSALKVGLRIKRDPGGGGSVNFAGPKLSAIVIVYEVKEGLRKIVSSNRLA